MVEIQFVACLIVPHDDFIYNTVFLSEEEKIQFLKEIKESSVSVVAFDEEVLKQKNLCVFSTCSYEFDNARTVLVGVLER